MRKKSMIVLILLVVFFLGCGQKRPVIYAPDARISVGETYDADDGVHALDAVDGDLTSNVIVTRGKLDVQKAGRYRICYEVTNSRGYQARTCRIITVSNQSAAFWHIAIIIAIAASAALVVCFVVWFLHARKNSGCVELPENPC